MARPDPESLGTAELARAIAAVSRECGIASHLIVNGQADVSEMDPETLAWWRAALEVWGRRIDALPREPQRSRDVERPVPRRVRAKEPPERSPGEVPAWQRGKREP